MLNLSNEAVSVKSSSRMKIRDGAGGFVVRQSGGMDLINSWLWGTTTWIGSCQK